MSNNIGFVYPNSNHKHGDSEYCIVKSNDCKYLLVSGPDMEMFNGSQINYNNASGKLCPLTVENAKAIRRVFDFTNPKSHKGPKITIGLGDRLGLASPGHIRAVRDHNVFPVLAQQSMRELDLTNRSYDDVLAAAVWAVFTEGYKKGYGADGDHLKNSGEVKNAINCGFTMITLDCSEHIRNELTYAGQDEVDAEYELLSKGQISDLEKQYLGKDFPINKDITLSFNEKDFKRIVLLYQPVVAHAKKIYDEFIKGKNIDFEVSIDETLSTTSPEAHYFTANELISDNVQISSLAPRFPGEFQKGIDYIGDISTFEKDFAVHAKIADTLGYRLSVHSGSDKFSVFPIVSKYAGAGGFHLKTAGTSWLEAVRVIARCAPALYRKLHIFALANLDRAKKYYHITENVKNIADINSMPDEKLPLYLEQDDARRVLHITYGLILMEKSENGTPLFRDELYNVLNKHESDYYDALEKHIEKHLYYLGI